jgi:hypothetical protein
LKKVCCEFWQRLNPKEWRCLIFKVFLPIQAFRPGFVNVVNIGYQKMKENNCGGSHGLI